MTKKFMTFKHWQTGEIKTIEFRNADVPANPSSERLVVWNETEQKLYPCNMTIFAQTEYAQIYFCEFLYNEIYLSFFNLNSCLIINPVKVLFRKV